MLELKRIQNNWITIITETKSHGILDVISIYCHRNTGKLLLNKKNII